MTEDYRAASELWAAAEKWGANTMDMANCLLELRARVEALESKQQIRVFTAEEVAPIVVPTVKESLADPAGSLLDRVARAIYDAPNTHEGWRSESRAAIQEVAAWLREQYDGDFVAASVLEQEANK